MNIREEPIINPPALAILNLETVKHFHILVRTIPVDQNFGISLRRKCFWLMFTNRICSSRRRQRARETEETHEFEDESHDEEPRIAGQVRVGDQQAPKNDDDDRVESITYVSQSGKTQRKMKITINESLSKS